MKPRTPAPTPDKQPSNSSEDNLKAHGKPAGRTRKSIMWFIALGLTMTTIVTWWESTEITQGGGFSIVVEGHQPEDFGTYIALNVREGRAKSFQGVVAALNGNPNPPSRQVRKNNGLRFGGADPLTSMGASSATAWVAANELLGTTIEYDIVTIVSSPPSKWKNLGVSADDPVVQSSSGVEVITDDGPVRISGEEAAKHLERALVVSTPLPAVTAPKSVTGSSAGIMYALAYLEHLTGEPLAGSLVVAGTGTINPNGTIGAVRGLAPKLEAAATAGADVVFIPATSTHEGRYLGAKFGIRVIAVHTLEEAVRWLCQHGAGRSSICGQVASKPSNQTQVP